MWSLHELSHWAVGEYLGYDMRITLNGAFPANDQFNSDRDYQIISAAGPIFNLVIGILFFILMIQRQRKLLYPFLFTCFYSRLLATLLSFRNPNDEARISKAFGLGTFTLPAIMTAILFFFVYKISRDYKFLIKFNLINLGLTILFSSVIILTDQYLHIQLL